MNAKLVRQLLIALVVLVVVALGFLAYSFFSMTDASQNLTNVQTNQMRSYLLADELRQSSDDLTRLVRAYAATGDRNYQILYNRVLAVRNGQIQRPEHYHRIYWDFVAASGEKPRPDSGVAVPLQTLMQEVGFTETELAKLRQAEADSNALVARETEAFHAIKGEFKGPDGEYSRVGKPDREIALHAVFSSEYQMDKAKIMKSVDEFYALMETRIEEGVRNAIVAQNKAQYLFLVTLAGALSMIALLGFFGWLDTRNTLAERAAAQKLAEDENEQLNNSVINILQAVNQLSQGSLEEYS